jgi:hypothetical protein
VLGRCLHKFSRNTVPSITCIHKLINKARSAGSLLDKKPAEKCFVLTKEKVDVIWARLEHTRDH